MIRTRPPTRRAALTFPVHHQEAGKAPMPFRVSIGLVDDRIAEVFIAAETPNQRNTQLDTLARDAGILLSMLLQYGAPLAEIGHALSRETGGAPQTLIGTVVDALRQEEMA